MLRPRFVWRSRGYADRPAMTVCRDHVWPADVAVTIQFAGFSSPRVGSSGGIPRSAPGNPTFERPVRTGSWPVTKAARPAAADESLARRELEQMVRAELALRIKDAARPTLEFRLPLPALEQTAHIDGDLDDPAWSQAVDVSPRKRSVIRVTIPDAEPARSPVI